MVVISGNENWLFYWPKPRVTFLAASCAIFPSRPFVPISSSKIPAKTIPTITVLLALMILITLFSIFRPPYLAQKYQAAKAAMAMAISLCFFVNIGLTPYKITTYDYYVYYR